METEDPTTSLFPSSLDDGEGPARTLSAGEAEALAAAVVRACGLSTTESKRYRWPVTTEVPLRSSEVAPGSTSANPLVAPRRTDSQWSSAQGARAAALGRVSRRGLRVTIAIAALASSTAAATVVTGWLPLAGEGRGPRTNLWVAATPVPVEDAKDAAPRRTLPQSSKRDALLVPSAAALGPPAEGGPLNPVPDAVYPVQAIPRKRAAPVVSAAITSEAVASSAPPVSSALVSSAPPPLVDALSIANALRAERRFDEAVEKYLEVIKTHPGSSQAAAARVAAASLKLEHQQDPISARALLISELAPGSPSIPEAEFLLTRTYQASGDPWQEREALSRFIARYPEHPLVPEARRRLQALPL